jgi:hypothetical protein
VQVFFSAASAISRQKSLAHVGDAWSLRAISALQTKSVALLINALGLRASGM